MQKMQWTKAINWKLLQATGGLVDYRDTIGVKFYNGNITWLKILKINKWN